MPSNPLPTRQLGKDGPHVPAIGFGLMGMSGAYGTPDDDEARFTVLDRALELGETFWDSADIYGDSEALLGKWFKRTGNRDRIFLATKFGLVMDSKTQLKGVNSSAEYCKQACEASLKKLGVDCIDLYYVHRLSHETPIEETMRAMVELKAEGKIKHIGLSEASSTAIRRAHRITPIAAVQSEYSPMELVIERSKVTHLLKTCRELGIALVAYSPLGKGLVSGTLTTLDAVNGAGDFRGKVFPRFSAENLPQNVALVQRFGKFAERKGCTTAQMALAWLLKQGEDVIPILGTRKVKYLEENLAALDAQLCDEEEAKIREFVESAELTGYRSVPSAEKLAWIDTREE